MTEITLNREFENFYCPVTGEQVLQPDDWFPSPALDFIYLDEFQEFQYMAPALMEKFPEYFEENGDSINGEELLQKLRYDSRYNKNRLMITYGTMGAARLCFNMGYEAE
jgi:hypothetical protein